MNLIQVRGKRVFDHERAIDPFKISSTLFPLFVTVRLEASSTKKGRKSFRVISQSLAYTKDQSLRTPLAPAVLLLLLA